VGLLSIGMVREDGKEYYAIHKDAYIIQAAAENWWLNTNVLKYFPLEQPIDSKAPSWDQFHPDYKHVKNKDKIAIEVANFIREVPSPSLWAWFAAYDHLMLSQLYGRMLDIPNGIPQRTNDVAQEAERLKVRVPSVTDSRRHLALDDAREVKFRREWLKEYENVHNFS